MMPRSADVSLFKAHLPTATRKLPLAPFTADSEKFLILNQCRCHKTTELHNRRHREIAGLLTQIQRSDGAPDISSPVPTSQKEKKSSMTVHDSENGGVNRPLDSIEDDSKILRTAGEENNSLQPQPRGVALSSQEKRQAKAERKTAKHQAQTSVVTTDQMEMLENVLHPDRLTDNESRRRNGQGLVNNATIEGNIAFVPTFAKQHSVRSLMMLAKAKDGPTQDSKDGDAAAELDQTIIHGLIRAFGIDPSPQKSTKGRRNLIGRLSSSIREDLVAVANEEQETMQRMAGYWRYANRRTYNAMVRMNEIWDWATGAKLQVIEEGNEDEDEDSHPEGQHFFSSANAPVEQSTSPQHSSDQSLATCQSSGPEFRVPSRDLEEWRLSLNASDDEKFQGLTKTTSTSITHPQRPETPSVEWQNCQDLAYSPGRRPGPTLTFSLPSPSSSDDLFDGEISDITETSESVLTTKPLTDVFGDYKSVKHDEVEGEVDKGMIEGCKDQRILNIPIRSPSPVREVSNVSNKKWMTKEGKRKSLATIKARTLAKVIAEGLLDENRFANLQNEVAAPKDEADDSKASTTSTPSKFNTTKTNNRKGTKVDKKGSDNLNGTPSNHSDLSTPSYKKTFPALAKSLSHSSRNLESSSPNAKIAIDTTKPSPKDEESPTTPTTTSVPLANQHRPPPLKSIPITPETIQLANAKQHRLASGKKIFTLTDKNNNKLKNPFGIISGPISGTASGNVVKATAANLSWSVVAGDRKETVLDKDGVQDVNTGKKANLNDDDDKDDGGAWTRVSKKGKK